MVSSVAGTAANVVLMVAYLAIAHSILWPLARTGQLYRNRLGFMTGLIFLSCGVGHALHADHAVRGIVEHGLAGAGIDWHLASWDSFTAVVALVYWRERRNGEPMVDHGAMFEDLQRRERELERELSELRLREAQERLNHLALHDPLTGLPNRVLFHDRAAAALRSAARSGRWTGCLFVDLDHFKVVNDSMGHLAGDQVLRELGRRLLDILRPGDTVARMGGDEFCLLLEDLEHPDEASLIADRVLFALGGVVVVDGVPVTTGASAGVTVAAPGDGATSLTLVRDADTALYRAKSRARGTQVVFDDAIRDEARRRLRWEADRRRALAEGQIGS